MSESTTTFLLWRLQLLLFLHNLHSEKGSLSFLDELLTQLESVLIAVQGFVVLARVQKLAVTVNLSLDLLGNNKLCDLALDLLEGKTKSLLNLSHVDDLIGSHVLYESLLPDLLHDTGKLVTEIKVILHL